MSDVVELSKQIADLWAKECELEERAILEGDPLFRSNLQDERDEVARERRLLHEQIAREPAKTPTELLILALFAADYFAQSDAGRTDRNIPLRHLHNSIIAGLEGVAGTTRQDLGLDFLWISPHDGPGTS